MDTRSPGGSAKVRTAEMKGRPQRNKNVDLGLAVLELMESEGKIRPPLTYEVIGSACGVSRERIRQIAARALRKIRTRLMFGNEQEQEMWRELSETFRILDKRDKNISGH